MISVRPTKYGRGYFASTALPAGTVVLDCSSPFAWVVFHEFKKEVCAVCFLYKDGQAHCKVRLSGPGEKSGGRAYGGLWFCSEQCRDSWSSIDPLGLVAAAWDRIEALRQRIQPDSNLTATKYSPELDLEAVWSQEQQSNNRPLKGLQHEQLDMAKFCAATLASVWLASQQVTDQQGLAFSSLQSNEAAHLVQFPEYLHSELICYRVLRQTLPEPLVPLLSTALVRDILGRDAGNAFGIFQLPLTLDSETLGSAMYPLASYFNHSCDPSVAKSRIGRHMVFTTTRPVAADEELYISYGMVDHKPYSERQSLLQSQWDFACRCSRCLVESQS